MGAETTVYVRAERVHETWIQVQAVSLAEACERVAREYPDMRVIEARYIAPVPAVEP